MRHPVFSAYCFLPTAYSYCISEFVFVIVVIVIFLDNIQFHGVEAYDFQICSAFFARYNVALVRVRIDMDISITLGTGSGRHFLYLQLSNLTAGCTRNSAGGRCLNVDGFRPHDNLTVPAGFCNTLFCGATARR